MFGFFSRRCWLSLLVAVIGLYPVTGQAQSIPSAATLLQHDSIKNAEAARWQRQLFLSPAGLTADNHAEPGEASMPRFAASLVSIQWLGNAPDGSLALVIEQDHWIVRWTQRPDTSAVIVLTFDMPPQLLSELEPVKAAGDGSILLPACMAVTTGEKIRYEPQTFKNTVGFWTGKRDSCEWKFETTRTGTFNVEVLQGCGTGQGGSRAKLTLPASENAASLEFDVLETGHFQNFLWRHLGTIDVTASGAHSLKIEPIEIKHAALVDIRAVHLIPVPPAK